MRRARLSQLGREVGFNVSNTRSPKRTSEHCQLNCSRSRSNSCGLTQLSSANALNNGASDTPTSSLTGGVALNNSI